MKHLRSVHWFLAISVVSEARASFHYAAEMRRHVALIAEPDSEGDLDDRHSRLATALRRSTRRRIMY